MNILTEFEVVEVMYAAAVLNEESRKAMGLTKDEPVKVMHFRVIKTYPSEQQASNKVGILCAKHQGRKFTYIPVTISKLIITKNSN